MEYAMIKKAKSKSKIGRTLSVSKGVHISKFIVDLFANQEKAKLPDETLAFIIASEFPNRSTEKNYLRYIPSYRNIYNRGEFSIQEGPPEKKVQKYVDGIPQPQTRGPKPREAGEAKKRKD